MRRSGELVRFLKFCLVGGSGVFVNTGMLWLLHDKAGWEISYALIAAIETAIITNFVLNNYITFSDYRKPGLKSFIGNFLRFNLFSVPGGILNWVTTVVLTNTHTASYLIFNMVGIAIAMLWNYIANNLWTWKR
jgi:dolichol-phosphate mannosyltransferase